MQTKTKRLIVLLELEDGAVHQVIMTREQERAVKAVLQSIATVQLIAEPLDLKIVTQGEKDEA